MIADLVPDRSVAESLLDAFPPARIDATGVNEKVLITRAEVGRDVLAVGLERLGYSVEVLPVYRTVRVTPSASDLDVLRSGNVDAITFTSASTVENFCDLVGDEAAGPTIVSIGPITSAAVRARGLTVGREADPHTIDGLVTAVLGALGSERDR